MPRLTDKERVIVLYFSSLGVGRLGVSALLEHKVGCERKPMTFHFALEEFKDTERLWNLDTRQWRLKRVGEHLLKMVMDADLEREFEDIIYFRDEEARILTDVYAHQYIPDHVMEKCLAPDNDVWCGYCNAYTEWVQEQGRSSRGGGRR